MSDDLHDRGCLYLRGEGFCTCDTVTAPNGTGDSDQEQQAAADRNALGRWLFERDYSERGLCRAYDAPWDEWVESNQEEWREEADNLLASPPIAAALAAAALIPAPDRPYLGLATTRELLDEVRARIETDVAGKGLDYRTVDPE